MLATIIKKKMTDTKYIKIATLTISVFLIFACKLDRQNGNQPRLPIAKNPKSIVSNDSCLFSISVRDSSIIVADYVTSIKLKNFEQIGDFVCQEIKNGNINPKFDYPVNLEIDSLTPISVFDRLIEELKLIGFQAVFLKTAEKGFFTAFSYNEFELLDAVIKLYGQKFSIERPVLTECSKDSELNHSSDSYSDAPPPPPSPYIDYRKLRNNIEIDSLGFCLVEKKGERFALNGKEYDFKELSKEIDKKGILIVKLTKDNVFNDLIKIIDLIKSTEIVRFDYFSKMKFNVKYSNLSTDKQNEIRREHRFSYLILSLAEQSCIDKK